MMPTSTESVANTGKKTSPLGNLRAYMPRELLLFVCLVDPEVLKPGALGIAKC